MNWNGYVQEAKVLISGIKSNKLKVARLALLATKLQGTDMTVARFAREIGMTTSALNKWIEAYSEYRKKHPVKEPEPKDYKPAAKSAQEAKKASSGVVTPVFSDRPKAKIHISIKTKDFLSQVNRLKERLKDKAEVKAMDDKVRKELIIKLREVASLLEKA